MQESSLRITVVDARSHEPLITLVREIWRYRGLLWAICKRECKTRYAQTVLGPLWFLFYPLMTASIFTVVFGLIVQIPSNGLPHLLFYLSAVILWAAFIFTINQIIPIFINSMDLIKKIYFPRLLLAGPPILIASLDFLVGFFVLCMTSIFFHCFHFTLLLFIPFLLLTVIFFAAGLGFFLAPLSTKYRDLTHLTPFALQCFYYATPILYPISKIPAWLKFWFLLNPMSTAITSLREIVAGHVPNLHLLFTTFFATLVFFLLGCWCFTKVEKNIVDLL